MAIQSVAQQAGMMNSRDLEFLSRVFFKTLAATDGEQARITRARALISLFRSGLTDEATLVEVVSHRGLTDDV